MILAVACIRYALVFSHIYKAPLIQVSSFGAKAENYATIGAPGHPFLYPSMIRRRINNLSMWEKINELYNTYKYINGIEILKITNKQNTNCSKNISEIIYHLQMS